MNKELKCNVTLWSSRDFSFLYYILYLLSFMCFLAY